MVFVACSTVNSKRRILIVYFRLEHTPDHSASRFSLRLSTIFATPKPPTPWQHLSSDFHGAPCNNIIIIQEPAVWFTTLQGKSL
jgi:hypothetical protein